jgi:hypothetical protein
MTTKPKRLDNPLVRDDTDITKKIYPLNQKNIIDSLPLHESSGIEHIYSPPKNFLPHPLVTS